MEMCVGSLLVPGLADPSSPGHVDTALVACPVAPLALFPKGRGKEEPCRKSKEEPCVAEVHMDFMFMGEETGGAKLTFLVAKERLTKGRSCLRD